MAVFIQEDGFVESALPCLIAGQRAVHIGSANLGACGNRIVFNAPPGAYACMKPFVAVQIFAEGQGDDGECILIVRATPMRSADL